jgi:hypothetical protein
MSQYCKPFDVTFGIVQNRYTVLLSLLMYEKKHNVVDFFTEVHNKMNVMEPFIEFGLNNISALSDQPKAACRIHSILAIDPDADTLDKSLFDSLQPSVLEILIRLKEHQVELCAHFDPFILSAPQSRRLLYHYTHGIQQCHNAARNQMAMYGIEWTSPENYQAINKWNNLETKDSVPRSILQQFHKVCRLYPRIDFT